MNNHQRKPLSSFVALAALALGVAIHLPASAGSWSTSVTPIDAKAGTAATAKGDLANGKKIALTWAAKSSVACFPATENVNFNGNHVLFGTQIPANSEMKVTAVPDDATTDISLYAYTIGSTDFTHAAPNVQSVTSCEAGYDAKNDANPGASESVKLVATTNPYNVVIGVAGANGAAKGGFTLKVELATKATVTSATLVPTVIESKAGGVVETTGKLEQGGIIDLGWAASSQVACWPATENVNFEGNHVLFRTTIPKQSEMVVTATPTSTKTDLSVYAIQLGKTDTTHVPPNLPSATSCEAGYDKKNDSNPGVAESAKLQATTNEYNVLIGVAGAKGVTAGDFKLKIDVHPR
jgi:hypothetical protein